MTTEILRPGHISLRVLDMEASVNHYTNSLGLIEVDRDDQGRVYLKGWDEFDKFSIVLNPSDRAGMNYLAFKVTSNEALQRYASLLASRNIPIQRIPAGELKGCGPRIRFIAPTGHEFELFAEKDYWGNGIPTTNPPPWPEGLKGMRAQRFDHVLLYGDDLDGSVTLFREVLGFKLAEQVVDGDVQLAAFLSCSNKAHDIAFVRSPEKGKLHHISFLLENWEEVLRAADLISMHDIPIDIGPTRHGITRGQTIYFFDPSGNRNEVFSGGYHYYPDHPVLTWTADKIGTAIFYHDRQLNDRFMSIVT
jgi:catechol 2,3-dioxygenase